MPHIYPEGQGYESGLGETAGKEQICNGKIKRSDFLFLKFNKETWC